MSINQKPKTPRTPNIPKLDLVNKVSSSISTNSDNNSESNNEILFDIAFELQKIISKLNSNLDSNQIIISQLKNTILTIYKKINEKSHNIHDSNNTNSYMSTESSSKNIHNFGYKKIVYQNGNKEFISKKMVQCLNHMKVNLI